MHSYLKQSFYLLISLVIIMLDQYTKHWAQFNLLPYEPAFITSFFNFTLAQNTGAAFSLLDSASGWQHLFFLSLNLSISLFILGWLFRLPKLSQKTILKSCGLSLVLGGALGNIIDRIHLGYVVDFLDFHIGSYHWPIFNIADSAVCVGVALLMIGISKDSKKGVFSDTQS